MVSNSEEIKKKVIEDLNEQYGRDLLDIDKCNELKNKLLEEKAKILKEVRLYCVTNYVSKPYMNFCFQLNISDSESSLHENVVSAEECIQKAEELVNESNEVLNHIKVDLKKVNDVRKKVREYFGRLAVLQCTHQYMRVIQHVEYLRHLM